MVIHLIGNIFPITQIVDTTRVKLKVGITTVDQTYVGFGTLYPYYNSTSRAFGSGYNGRVAVGVSVFELGHTGNTANITAEVLLTNTNTGMEHQITFIMEDNTYIRLILHLQVL